MHHGKRLLGVSAADAVKYDPFPPASKLHSREFLVDKEKLLPTEIRIYPPRLNVGHGIPVVSPLREAKLQFGLFPRETAKERVHTFAKLGFELI